MSAQASVKAGSTVIVEENAKPFISVGIQPGSRPFNNLSYWGK